jgi:hypothetical protein
LLLSPGLALLFNDGISLADSLIGGMTWDFPISAFQWWDFLRGFSIVSQCSEQIGETNFNDKQTGKIKRRLAGHKPI